MRFPCASPARSVSFHRPGYNRLRWSVAGLLRPQSSTPLAWRAMPERRSIEIPLPTTGEKCFSASAIDLRAFVGYRPTPAFFEVRFPLVRCVEQAHGARIARLLVGTMLTTFA